LHNEELHNLCNKIKEDEMEWSCSTHGRDEKCVQKFSMKITVDIRMDDKEL